MRESCTLNDLYGLVSLSMTCRSSKWCRSLSLRLHTLTQSQSFQSSSSLAERRSCMCLHRQAAIDTTHSHSCWSICKYLHHLSTNTARPDKHSSATVWCLYPKDKWISFWLKARNPAGLQSSTEGGTTEEPNRRWWRFISVPLAILRK